MAGDAEVVLPDTPRGAERPAALARPVPPYTPVRPARVPALLARFIMAPPQRVLALVRLLWPIPRLFGRAAVLRHDDVTEVLRRHDVFRVPFGDEIARLNDGEQPGTPFALGVDDPLQHNDQVRVLMQVFTLGDIAEKVARAAHRSACRRLALPRRGPFEAIHGLLTAVPLDICRNYFGVDITEEEGQTFAYATLELSGHLFGFPPIEPSNARREDDAAAYVQAIVDRSIARALAAPDDGDTALARLVRLHRKDPAAVTPRVIRAILIGMITGFVPTNRMAGGHMLEMLLRKPKFLECARQAALAGDDERLMRILFEALRYMPINLGPFRICRKTFCVAADTPRATTLREGTIVLVSTASAMFDSATVRHPFRFDPSRPASHYLHFGFGMHWCVGAMIARAQLTQTFKALLVRSGLERADGREGSLALWGLFPDRLRIHFDDE
jgi:cytochrome P450